MSEKRVSASTEIAASPETIYAMVSDLPRMGEWSPDNVGGEWLGGATEAAVGAKFKGKNKNGKKTWTGLVVVTDAVAPNKFAFTTVVGPMKIGNWSYQITPTGSGCAVTETWEDTRNAVFSLPILGKVITGVADRPTHNKAAMETTLANMKKAAEGSAT